MKKKSKIVLTIYTLIICLISNSVLATECISCNGTEIPYALSVLSRNIINLVQLLVPVIIIITGMIELLRAVIAGDEKKMDEVKPKLARKFIAGVIIFLIFAIVKFGFSFLGSRASASFECASYFISEDASGHTSECKTREDAINGTEGPSSSSPSGKLHCNDYTYSECPISDETGIKCRKNDVNKTCNPASLKLSCGDYSYNDCPDYDEKGNKCQSVVGDSTHKFCTEDGTYKRCTDYNYKQLGYCPQQDSYGNNCKTQSTGNSFICIGA